MHPRCWRSGTGFRVDSTFRTLDLSGSRRPIVAGQLLFVGALEYIVSERKF